MGKPSKGELTRNQILHVVISFKEKHDRYPTFEEIQDLTGIRSFNTILRHLGILKQERKLDPDNLLL